MCFAEMMNGTEISSIKELSDVSIDKEVQNKFDKLIEDNGSFENERKSDSINKLSFEECEEKLDDLLNNGDFFVENEYNSLDIDNNLDDSIELDRCEIDDYGTVYKKDGEILPDIEYSLNGITYRTDYNSNKVSCDSIPTYTEDGLRNTKEQMEAGGSERHKNDDGGHIVARVLGGSEGEENLVPMRSTINRGDYKKMENEMAAALKEGKDVRLHVDLEYADESKRPSKIVAEYDIDGSHTKIEFDNEENSIELLDSVCDKINQNDYNSLKNEINDMRQESVEVSITSVKTEYYDNGEPKKVTVGMLDEDTKQKTYKVFEAKSEVR